MIEQLRTFGIATGSFMRNLFARHGVVTEGYMWDYRPGISRETFMAHRVLHELKLESPHDAKLLNPLNFPRSVYFYPGDHNGCRCYLRPEMYRTSRITGRRIEVEPELRRVDA